MRVAIIGCGYVGTAVAQNWCQELGIVVTATTTRQERVSELSALSARAVVIKGDNTAQGYFILKSNA